MKRIFQTVVLSFLSIFSLYGNEAKRIVCFGDSLTSCGGKGGRYSDMLQKSLPEYKCINSGKGGDSRSSLKRRSLFFLAC